jgi:hypothetical protein
MSKVVTAKVLNGENMNVPNVPIVISELSGPLCKNWRLDNRQFIVFSKNAVHA